MKQEPLTSTEIDELVNLVRTLGEDCLVITPRELGKKLGLDADHLMANLTQYNNSHDLRRVLRGEETLGAAVTILFLPPDPTGPGGIMLFSSKPEFTADYLKHKTVLPGPVN